jgi:hypothetical protein
VASGCGGSRVDPVWHFYTGSTRLGVVASSIATSGNCGGEPTERRPALGSPLWRGAFDDGRQEAAGCHHFFGRGKYGLHCKGVTASGVPLPELTQPAAVSLNGLWSSYGSPPSVTISATS